MRREGAGETRLFGGQPRETAARDETEPPGRDAERRRAEKRLVGTLEGYLLEGYELDALGAARILTSIAERRPEDADAARELRSELNALTPRLGRETLGLLAAADPPPPHGRDLGGARAAGFSDEELGDGEVERILDCGRLLLALRPRSPADQDA